MTEQKIPLVEEPPADTAPDTGEDETPVVYDEPPPDDVRDEDVAQYEEQA